MAKIDTHGLNIVGLRNASGETYNRHWRDQSHDEIFYNMETGEVWTVYQYGLKTRVYDDPNIIKIGNAWKHETMQSIADMINEVITKRKIEEENLQYEVSKVLAETNSN